MPLSTWRMAGHVPSHLPDAAIYVGIRAALDRFVIDVEEAGGLTLDELRVVLSWLDALEPPR